MNIERICALALVVVVALSLSACDGKKSGENKSDPASSPEQQTAITSEPTTSFGTFESKGTVTDEPSVTSETGSESSETASSETVSTVSKPTSSAVTSSKQKKPKTSETASTTEPDPVLTFVYKDDFLNATTFTKLQEKYLKLINAERATKSLGALKIDKDLDKIAAFRCKETQSVFSHTRPNGSDWATAIPKSYPKRMAGENLTCTKSGSNDPTPLALTDEKLDEIAEQAFTAFKNSTDHYENLMMPDYTQVGICFNIIKEVDGEMIYYSYYCTNIYAALK